MNKEPRRFMAMETTADGRLTEDHIYCGEFVYKRGLVKPGWRIEVVDNKGQIMTFNPKVFYPVTLEELR